MSDDGFPQKDIKIDESKELKTENLMQENLNINLTSSISDKDYAKQSNSTSKSSLIESLKEAMNFYKAENANSMKAQDLPKSRRLIFLI